MSEQGSTNVNKWSLDQVRFMQWLALPKAERKPKTQKALAAEINVSEKTLCDWKRMPGFANEVVQLAREYVKDAIPEVLATMRREAINGNLPYVDRVLAMSGLGGDIEAANKGSAPQVNMIFEAEVQKAYGTRNDSSDSTAE